jgi:hypothetical protein
MSKKLLTFIHIANRFSAMIDRKEPFFRLMVRESQSSPEVAACLQAIVGEGVKALAAYLETRIQLGELRSHDTTLTARMLLGTVFTENRRKALSVHARDISQGCWSDERKQPAIFAMSRNLAAIACRI